MFGGLHSFCVQYWHSVVEWAEGCIWLWVGLRITFPAWAEWENWFQGQKGSLQSWLKLTQAPSSLAEQGHWICSVDSHVCLLDSAQVFLAYIMLEVFLARLSAKTVLGATLNCWLGYDSALGPARSLFEGPNQADLHPVRFTGQITPLPWLFSLAKLLVRTTTQALHIWT